MCSKLPRTKMPAENAASVCKRLGLDQPDTGKTQFRELHGINP